MNVLITANLTPFFRGGADHHIHGLSQAIRAAGHQVDLIRWPFKFQPESDVERLMAACDGFELSRPNGHPVDRVISLQFPGYGVVHPKHVAWIMHQHRAVYELFDPATASPELTRLRERVIAYDKRCLGQVHQRFANSQRVAERLQTYNGLAATPLYHPPARAQAFFCGEAQPYVFFPSRLESLKRQDLVLEAARRMKSPLAILFAGTGGQAPRYAALAAKYDLGQRVRFLGHISEAQKLAFYAQSLAVCFPPFDEDYGYITLEAMLSGKPVITCKDSGGPTEFIEHGENGFVLPPDPDALAEHLDWLHAHQDTAARMGRAARQSLEDKNISWDAVVRTLLESA